MMKFLVLFSMVFLYGCSSLLTTKQTDDTLLAYVNSDVSKFLMDQPNYNIDKPGYNILLGSGGDPSYFLYRPALDVKEQVEAPAYNLKRLCLLSNGRVSTTPFTGKVQIDSIERLKGYSLNRNIINQLPASMLKTNLLSSYDNELSYWIKKDQIISTFQKNKLEHYINNNYFYNEILCTKANGTKWSVSIIPVAIQTDSSGLDQLLLYMGVLEH
ncbi:hypothetical protein C5F64_13815 [Photobacterium damselae subsp. damselae]|uniref:hypothetical protein n=1 Tax=Photobacterium damselae TaxID=38293 RepID=UPI000D05DB1F|nr:hypothetical protein [Photobacterium damselae]PSB84118.1 hypothetical protein C5F64_13815 [Photobacterium damselae subsp. damselae]